jgi:hypothetical protein
MVHHPTADAPPWAAGDRRIRLRADDTANRQHAGDRHRLVDVSPLPSPPSALTISAQEQP